MIRKKLTDFSDMIMRKNKNAAAGRARLHAADEDQVGVAGRGGHSPGQAVGGRRVQQHAADAHRRRQLRGRDPRSAGQGNRRVFHRGEERGRPDDAARRRRREDAIHGDVQTERNGGGRFHRRRFERLVGIALRRLPPEFADYLDNVAILVADEASPEQMMHSETGSDDLLFGLYEGIPRTARSEAYGMVIPDRITLFRRAFEESCASEAEMIEEIRRTIIHEVGHHNGWGEDRLRDV